MPAADHVTSPSVTTPLIRAENLEKSRGGRLLWIAQTFEVEPGTSLAITGPSGAGKSTLLNCIGLLDHAEAGTLQIAGEHAESLTPSRRRYLLQTTVGHLIQNYGLVETWTVEKNIDVAFIGRRVPRRERERLRRAALERVDLGGCGPRRAHGLSGGEQQRVALARILVKRPQIVVADEPSAALDTENVAMVLSVLDELREQGAAILVATHDELVAEWCDQHIRLGELRSPAAEAVSGEQAMAAR